MEIPAFFFALLLAAAGPGLAPGQKHGDARAKHGGQAAELGPYHMEIVLKDREVMLYVSGHDDRPLDAKGVEATAAIFSGKDKGTVALTPAGRNVLKGSAPFTSGADAKVVVTVTLPGKKTEQARFQPGREH